MSICEIGFGKCCGVQCFTKRSVPIVTSHVTSEPVLRLDVPNRCFWRISQLPRSFVCPCPSSFKNASLESNSKQAVFFFFFFLIGVVFQSGGDWQTYFIIHIHKMFFSLIIIIKLQVFALLTPGTKHESSALWSCVIFDSLSAIFQKTEALTLEILTSLPRSVPLSFFSCWSGPLLPCRSRIKFAAASSFFLLFFSLSLSSEAGNSQKTQKPCGRVFSHWW